MHTPTAGECITVEPGIRMVLAPNPGPMTYWGTNSFIIGEGKVAIIDPGPKDKTHLAALIKATKGETVTHILISHPHLDHSPLSRELARTTNAPIYGFGPPDAGRSDMMKSLAAGGLAGGGEGVDLDFRPDLLLADGDTVAGQDWTIDVVHTPGHFSGHLSFSTGEALMSGDHVMDWSSSLVSPPDGDISAFMATSARLFEHPAKSFYPSHGGPLLDPADRLSWLIEHRKKRETAILDVLTDRPQSIEQLTAKVYHDIDPDLRPAAARNVFAHIIDLVERNIVKAIPRLELNATFAAI